MSNILAPNGFSPLRRKDSAAATYGERVVPMAATNAHTIAKGDPVQLLNTGYVDLVTAAQAIAAPCLLGIFQGVEYYDTVQMKKLFLPTWSAPSSALAGSVFAHINDDEGMVFQVQVGNGIAAQANVGQNCNFLGQGNPTLGGISQATIDATSFANTAALPFRVIGLGNQIGNDNTSNYNWIEVAFNSQLNNSLTGV